MSKLCRVLLFLILFIYSPEIYSQKKIDSFRLQLDSLNQKTENFQNDTNKVNVLNALSWQHSIYYDDTIVILSYAQEALNISNKIKWKRGVATSYFFIGNYFQSKSKYDLALFYFIKSQKMREELNDRNGTAISLYTIGQVYELAGNYPAALDYYLQTLKINEETENNKEMALTLNHMGAIYSALDVDSDALDYYLRALKINKALNDKYWIAINITNIAGINSKRGEYENALNNYFYVLKLEGGDKYSSVGTLIDIGDVYKEQAGIQSNKPAKDSLYALSLHYLVNAQKIADEIKDDFSKGLALNSIGSIYLSQNNLIGAGSVLNDALSLIIESESPEAIKECYYNLSILDSLRGQWKKSLEYYRKYQAIEDSMFNKKKSWQIARLQIDFATDKKQKQIEILNKDNELKNLRIEKQAKNILLIIAGAIILLMAAGGLGYYRSRKIKQRSLRQISEAKLASLKSLMDKHFIFSSLHSIDTFLMNNDSEAASDYLVKYSKLIRMILEMSTQPEVTLEEEIILCRSYLDLEKIRFSNSFDFEFSIAPGISPKNTRFPSMLLQPLVENAVKHGISSLSAKNEKKGSIRIDIKKEKSKLVCLVSDNGKGISVNDKKDHRSYSGKGIQERVRVYNNLRKGNASFVLKENNPGVIAELILPYVIINQPKYE